MKTYYFISYAWQRNGWELHDWVFEDDVTTKHPVRWLIECKEHKEESYKIIFWSEIPKDVYDAAYGILG
jgi:hypothetical protein